MIMYTVQCKKLVLVLSLVCLRRISDQQHICLFATSDHCDLGSIPFTGNWRWHRWDSRETGPYLIGRAELQYRTPSTAITCASIPVRYMVYFDLLLCFEPSPPYVHRHLAFVFWIMYQNTCLGCVWYSVPMRAGTVRHSPIKYALGLTGVTG
jgi:hypothetical protein